MKAYILNFLSTHNYPEMAISELLRVYALLEKKEVFFRLLDDFYKETIDTESQDGPIGCISRELSVNFYTVKLLFYICLSKNLKIKYQKAGYSEAFFFENMTDLYCKTMECYEVFGVWGIFASGWFNSVFKMNTFTLGRLCYNIGSYRGEAFSIAKRKVEKNDRFISIHIPSTPKPFDKASRMQSYEMAYNFFKDVFKGREPLFGCDSWLLYPPNKMLLSEKSNIVSFMEDFRIVDSYEYNDDHILWRIFGKDYRASFDKLPRDSSLRKAYADFIAQGNKTGAGIGFFVYDPINKTTLK